MAEPAQSVFDSLVESRAPSALDPVLAEWLVRRLLDQGQANGLQQLVDDMKTRGMGAQLEGWLAGRARPLAATDVDALSHANGVLDPTVIDALAAAKQADKTEVRAKIGELIPGVVQALMPRGEVPSWRALELGLNSMSKSLATSRTSQSR